jgi:hypothetical protein
MGGPDCVGERPAGATAEWVESGLGVDLDVGIDLAMKRRMRSSAAAQVWFGTSRQDSFTSARAGIAA